MTKIDFPVYPAIFDNVDNDGYYTVTFPDVTDTVTDGATMAEALHNAPEALGIALLDYADYPAPTDLKVVQAAHPDLYVSLVGVDMRVLRRKAHNRTARKQVTVPMDLATAAEHAGLNFSQVLTKALEETLD